MRVLVTRPMESAYPLINRLEELGHQPLFDPLICTTPIDPTEVLQSFPTNFEAIVTTSQIAIRCLANLTPRRDFPLWCVGGESAKVAKELGFDNIHAAEGSAEDLLDKLFTTLSLPLDKPLIHLSGDVVRVDMVKPLQERGIPAQHVVVYKTQEATALSCATQAALKAGGVDAVLFYSPRTGFIFQNLCKVAKLEHHCKSLTAICLSAAIKAAIMELPWNKIRIAKKNTTDDLLIALRMAD
jgi:uroporphyrinogen-III synthase